MIRRQDVVVDNFRPVRAEGIDLLGRLTELQSAFAGSIPSVPAATPVPWCGDWTVTDLVEHLAFIHHWAAALARSEDDRPLPALPPTPTSSALLSRYEECAAELRETLARLDPRSPARTLVDGGTVAFWHRRQVHETLIHLWDLRTAGGLALDVDAALWADTVDEAVTVMHPRQVRLGRTAAPPVRLELTAVDVDRRWVLVAAAGASQEPVATVSGPAAALALLVWRRTGLDDVRLGVQGDAKALQEVLADRFVP